MQSTWIFNEQTPTYKSLTLPEKWECSNKLFVNYYFEHSERKTWFVSEEKKQEHSCLSRNSPVTIHIHPHSLFWKPWERPIPPLMTMSMPRRKVSANCFETAEISDHRAQWTAHNHEHAPGTQTCPISQLPYLQAGNDLMFIKLNTADYQYRIKQCLEQTKTSKQELKKKRKAYGLWRKGQATQEDYKFLVRLCREKDQKC